ncbi:MAG: hypothetical protein K0R00_163 [Herbinix sp.]|jgi:hypothetical protein|nr:hypothetical protein [Herbinix sp.]
MISIKEIQLSSQYGVDFIYGKIILNDTSEDIAAYKIDLYKSNNSTDNFSLLKTDITKMTFLDYGVNLKNLSTHYFYKAEITLRQTGEAHFSEVFSLENMEPDKEAYYLIELYKIHLETAINNRKMILLSRKHEGQHCTVCYDDVRKKSQLADCNFCFGTNYTGGYYEPQIIQTVFLNAPGQMQDFSMSGVGEKKAPISLWTINYPLIQNDDILIDINNNRYIVNSWQPSYKNFYLIRQTVQATMAPKTSIIYNIPVGLDALRM